MQFQIPPLPQNLPLSRRQLFVIAIVILVSIVVLILLYTGLRGPLEGGGGVAPIVVWGIDDGTEAFKDLTQSYSGARGIQVDYQSFRAEEYPAKLLNALAAGKGPDVFMIHNHWLPRDKDKLVPADPAVMDATKLSGLFPTVVGQDFTDGNSVYAMPLAIDTMALIYNRDLFDQAGIVQPPKTWTEFQNLVPSLRSVDSRGQIVRAAAAVGGSERTVKYGIDLLQLLMLQLGTEMTNANHTVADFMNAGPAAQNSASASPGIDAFNFYIQFANSGSPYYTWNDSQPESLDSFASGKTAMVFGYHADLKTIKEKSPFLNYLVAPVPQPAGSDLGISYADYWGLGVSGQSKESNIAWDFIVYVTTNSDANLAYLVTSGGSPALRSLIGQNVNDADVGIFAREALTARSWYQADEDRVRQIFNTMIGNAISGRLPPESALGQAQEQVTALLNQN